MPRVQTACKDWMDGLLHKKIAAMKGTLGRNRREVGEEGSGITKNKVNVFR